MKIDWNDWEEDDDRLLLTDKIFEQFLIDNNALDKFIYYLNEFHYDIQNYCNNHKNFYFYAFWWGIDDGNLRNGLKIPDFDWLSLQKKWEKWI